MTRETIWRLVIVTIGGLCSFSSTALAQDVSAEILEVKSLSWLGNNDIRSLPDNGLLTIKFLISNEESIHICLEKQYFYQTDFVENPIVIGKDTEGNDLITAAALPDFLSEPVFVSAVNASFVRIPPFSQVTSVLLVSGLAAENEEDSLIKVISSLQIRLPYSFCPDGSKVSLPWGDLGISEPLDLVHGEAGWRVLYSEVWAAPEAIQP